MNANFWLLCGLWSGVGGGAFMWLRLRKAAAAGHFAADGAARFCRALALWILVPCLILWLLQLSAGPGTSPHYLRWPQPQRLAALMLQVFLWAALLYWVFGGKGANTLSTYFRATPVWGPLMTPVLFRIMAVIVVLAGLAALLAPDLTS